MLFQTNVTAPLTRPLAVHVFHQYVIRSRRRDELKSFLQDQGIATQIHYPAPVHLQPAYAGRVVRHRGGLPRTEAAAREVLSLPMSPYLQQGPIEEVGSALALWQQVEGRTSLA
jgi:dTDP-4-amino-4,6-dideoxygalactose transaminase